MFAGMAMKVFDTGHACTALALGTSLKDTKKFGSSGMFAHYIMTYKRLSCSVFDALQL